MNNPEQSIGTRDFFAGFEYRFSDEELKYIRHAPLNFIEMGGPYYGDSVADSASSSSHGWKLQADVRRTNKVFDFLEPVVIDVTLTNWTDRPQVVDEGIFADGHNLTISITRPTSGLTTLLRPFVIHCRGPRWRVLQPGESLHHSAFASVGIKGWHISEPGPYEVRVGLTSGSIQALSDRLRLRVATPCGRDEETIAQDFFTDEVGRALVLGGAAETSQAHTVLEQLVDRYAERPVARHAQLSLGIPKMKAHKTLRVAEGEAPMCSVTASGGVIAMVRGRPEEARRLLKAALRTGGGLDTLGTDYHRRMTSQIEEWLQREGDSTASKKPRSKRK